MKFRRTNTLYLKEKEKILELWNNEYPQNLRYESPQEFDNYLKGLNDPNHILVIDNNEKIIGWYFDFIREDERWFAVIINSEYQGNKIGTSLIEMAKKNRPELNGWIIISNDYIKCNGKPYRSPIGFYEKSSFQINKDILLETDKIKAVKIKWQI